MRVTGFPLQAIISEPRVWPRGDSIRGPQPNDMLDIQTHRLEKPVTKQQRSLKLSRENNSSASAKLSFCTFRIVASVFASGVASIRPTFSALSTDPQRHNVDMDATR